MTNLPVFCGKDCGGDACPLMATVENGRVMRVTNNPAGGRYLKGCARGFDLPLVQYAEERLLTPLIRTGPRGTGQFRRASWEEALDLTAQRLGEVREKHGADAVLNMGSAGSTGALHGTYPLAARFLNLFGGCTRLKGSYSNAAACFALPYVLGDEWTRAGFDPATMQYAQMILLWGANVLDTRLGTELPQRLVEARQRGVPIVVIDPRRSATVKHASTWWIPIKPGTDAALMLAVLHVLLAEGLVEREFIAAHSVGFEQLERYVLGQDGGEARSPEWAAAVCGVPAQDIARLARMYAAAKPAMLIPGYSIQRVYAGEETYRLAVALQLATGNLGRKGGSTGALNNRLPTPRTGSMKVPYLPDQPVVPVVRWPDAILEGKQGGYPTDIHAAYVMGGNFANQGSDVRKNLRAFEKLDFAVCHDLFLTPTAKCCDVVFPAAAPLEKEDIGIPWLGNYLLYKPQAVAPRGEARSDYDILWDLAERLGFGSEFSEGRTAGEWIDEFIRQSEVPDAEAFRRTGIYLAPDQERAGLADFRADPERYPLSTPSGKVEIASERYREETGQAAIPTWQPGPEDARFPLRMITPKSAAMVHSQGGSVPAIRAKAGLGLSMHPRDAAERGIQDGDCVRIYNLQGSARIPVRISDDLIPGVVCLPEGAWFELDGQGEERAGSPNVLTSTEGTRPGVACIMHGVGVEVERA